MMCHMVIWTEVSDGEGKFGWRATLGNARGYSKTFPRDFLTFLDFLRIVLVAIV